MTNALNEPAAAGAAKLLAVGGPLHGRVVAIPGREAKRLVITGTDFGKPVISGDAVDGAVGVYDRVWVYEPVRIDGLLVWGLTNGARSKETVIDALATVAGIERL
jgi:hypothetical protein